MTNSIAIYCGENENMHPDHVMAASLIGEALAKSGVKIVYGGTRHGLMGVIARSALKAGGEVVGVVTKATSEDRYQPDLTELHVVEDLDARKRLMTEISEASLVLPGGHGTMDEFERELTLVKFGQKNGENTDRNIILFDPNGFFSDYQKFVRKMGEIKGDYKDSYLYTTINNDVRSVLNKLGIMSDEEYERKYAHTGMYGSIPVTREAIDAHSAPISSEERQKQLGKGYKIMFAGAAAFTAGCVASAAPITVPLCIVGFFAFAGGNAHNVETYSRPIHEPALPEAV